MNQFSSGKRPSTASIAEPSLKSRKQARIESSSAALVSSRKQRESSKSSASSRDAVVRSSKQKEKPRHHHKQKSEAKRKTIAVQDKQKKKKKDKKKHKVSRSHQLVDDSSHSDSSNATRKHKKLKKSSVEAETVKKKKKKDKKAKKAKLKASKKTKVSKASKELPPKNLATSYAVSTSSASSSVSSASSVPSSPATSAVAAVSNAPCHYENSDSDADAANSEPGCPPLRPIADYLDDRAEMLHQMFSATRGQQLRALVPEEFRRWPLTKLRDRCLPLLQGMSAKRIRRILAGDSAASISSSDTDESLAAGQKLDSDAKAVVDEANVAASNNSTPIAAADSTTTEDQTEAKFTASLSAQVAADHEADDDTKAIEFATADSKSEVESSVKGQAEADSEATVESETEAEAEPNSMTEEEAAVSNEESEDVIGAEVKLLNFSVAEAEADSVILNEVVDLSDVEDEPAPQPPPRQQPSLDGMSRRQLKIMELEMRARAIQAMIKAQEKGGGNHTAL